MQLLTVFNNARAAYALSDYLNCVGIPSRVEMQQAAGAGILVEHDQDMVRAAEELRAFLQDPQAEKYREASWRKGAPSDPALSGLYDNSQSSFVSRWRKTGLFTRTILVICILVFLLTSFGGNYGMTQHFFFFFSAEEMSDISQIWRWITPVFLHFGILHITFNLLWWWDIASIIERLQGSKRLVWVFLLSAMIPNLAQFISAGNNFGGLSGVVFAILGYVWIYGRVRYSFPLKLRPVIIYMMVGWMLIGFSGWLDDVVGSMANEAHLAGLLTGLALGAGLAVYDMFAAVKHKNA